jgi:hypothetical protein
MRLKNDRGRGISQSGSCDVLSNTDQNTRGLANIVAEHRNLQQRCKQLRQLVSQPREEAGLTAAICELSLQVRELRDLLKLHLVREAAGGYLEEAVARVPRLSPEADAVERQHPELLRELAALIEAVKTARPSLDNWARIGRTVERFVVGLLAHESAENQILQQGFNEDPAIFDLDRDR